MAVLISLFLLLLTANNAQAEWVIFDLFKTPIYNANGAVVAEGEVVKHRDTLYGAIILYPSLSGLNIIERYDTGKNLLIKTDAAIMEDDRKAQYTTVNKVRNRIPIPIKQTEYDWKDFKAKKIKDNEAENLKIEWGFVKLIPESLDSGVTK